MDDFLNNLQGLRIMPQVRIKGGSGIHLGNSRGVSMDFHGHSAYSPGEDLRKIDWKAYARTGSLYVKDFTEERQINIGVLLDRSASMDFGRPNKWGCAVKLALGLSYLTLQQGDRLSFLTAGSGLGVIKDHAAGREHFNDVLKSLRQLKPAEETEQQAFIAGVEYISGMVFILSDLFNLDTGVVLDCLAVHGLQAVVIHILAPDELEPPCAGELKLVDAETGRTKRIVVNTARQRQYTSKMKAYAMKWRGACIQRGAGYVLARSDAEATAIIRQALEVC